MKNNEDKDISGIVLGNEVHHLREDFEKFTQIFEKYVTKRDREIDNIKEDVQSLKEWKIGFVAKFSAYSALALFLGSLLSQILIFLINQKFL